MVQFQFVCSETGRGRLPVTHFLMSGPMAMLSGQAQVNLGECWLITGAGRHKNSQPPFMLLLSMQPFVPTGERSVHDESLKPFHGLNCLFVVVMFPYRLSA